jgi:hypothetical protein
MVVEGVVHIEQEMEGLVVRVVRVVVQIMKQESVVRGLLVRELMEGPEMIDVVVVEVPRRLVTVVYLPRVKVETEEMYL